MAISESEVRHVALLARLALTDEQVRILSTELNSILDHIDALQQMDLADVEPMTHAVPMVNAMREDVVRPRLDHDLALLNAPESQDGAFLIPRIVGAEDDQ